MWNGTNSMNHCQVEGRPMPAAQKIGKVRGREFNACRSPTHRSRRRRAVSAGNLNPTDQLRRKASFFSDNASLQKLAPQHWFDMTLKQLKPIAVIEDWPA